MRSVGNKTTTSPTASWEEGPRSELQLSELVLHKVFMFSTSKTCFRVDKFIYVIPPVEFRAVKAVSGSAIPTSRFMDAAATPQLLNPIHPPGKTASSPLTSNHRSNQPHPSSQIELLYHVIVWSFLVISEPYDGSSWDHWEGCNWIPLFREEMRIF